MSNGVSLEPDLSIIVCSYNGAARLTEFLPALDASARASGCTVQLVVVDDGSTDGTAGVVTALAPDTTLVCSSDNRGLPAARNSGAASATAPWLLYCDDDVVISAPAISDLWASRRAGTCLVPVVVGPDGAIQNSVTMEWRLGDPRFRFHEAPVTDLAYPVGSCFLVGAADYRRAGGCDERLFPMYYDDAALGARLRRAGTEVVMTSKVTVVHYQHGNQSSPARLRAIQGWVLENRWVYVLTQLRGRQRVVSLSLGLPRVIIESARTRSPRPLQGYARALRRVPELIRRGAGSSRRQ